MTQLAEAIMSLYEKEETRAPRRRELSASDGLASACERLAWYEYNSPQPRGISNYLRRRFKYGNLHEDFIVDECGRLPSDQWKIKGSQLNINLWGKKGKVDLLVREGGHWKLLEIKTMNPIDFERFKTIGMEAFPRYYEQSQFYLAGLQKIPFKESEQIRSGILLGENTFPLGELYAVEFPLDEDLIEEMEEKTNHLDEVIFQVEPPLRPFTKESTKCQHCFRKEQCWDSLQEPLASRDHLTVVEPEVFIRIYNEYLHADIEAKDWKGKLEESKLQLRNIMEQEGLTSLAVNFSGMQITIDLKDVEVAPYSVEANHYVRMDIKLR